MLTFHSTVPPGVYALADHLDGALAAGEDLLAVRLAATADLAPGVAPAAALADVVRALRRQEAAVLLHLLQARRRAAEVEGGDAALRTVLRLVAGQTSALLDLVATFDPDRETMLIALADVQQFLRERGVIAPDVAGLGAFQALEIGSTYRIGGVVEVGGLLDMAASALDLLDQQYELYAEDETVVTGTSADGEIVVVTPAPAEAEGLATSAVPDTTAEPDAATASNAATTLTPGSLAAALDEVNRRPASV